MWDNIDFLYSDNLQCHKSASACVIGQMASRDSGCDDMAGNIMSYDGTGTYDNVIANNSDTGIDDDITANQTSEPIVTGLAYSRLVLRTSASMG